jgi:hypothetical protein
MDFFPFSLTLSIFLAVYLLSWRGKMLVYSPVCLEKLIHTPD